MERMTRWQLCREMGRWVLIAGLAVQASPVVWAQFEPVVVERDPILAATVEAAVKADPDLQRDAELRNTVEQLTKDCLTDPRARAEVASEVDHVRAEGGAEKVIGKEVLTAVRAEASNTFAAREADIRKGLEALPVNSTERKMAELSIEHSKQVMEAYAKGEAAPPPPREMVAHAGEMFKEWAEKSGASQQDIDMAKYALEKFSHGEMAGPMGPGGFGPGQGMEMGPPSDQQLKAMADAGTISPEKLAQMQKDKAAWESGDQTTREAMMQKYAGEAFQQGSEGGFHQGFEGFGGPTGNENQGQGVAPRDAFERWAAAEGHNVSPEQLDKYREIATQDQRGLEQQAREIQQQSHEIQQQLQEVRQEVTVVREVFASRELEAHVAEHDGDPFNGPEARLHDHYTHIMSDGTTVDHIHDVPVGTP